MDHTFDLVVVGTGAAASTVANRCRAAGWSVAIVDELPYGGTCQLRGCDPKKVLRRGAPRWWTRPACYMARASRTRASGSTGRA